MFKRFSDIFIIFLSALELLLLVPHSLKTISRAFVTMRGVGTRGGVR